MKPRNISCFIVLSVVMATLLCSVALAFGESGKRLGLSLSLYDFPAVALRQIGRASELYVDSVRLPIDWNIVEPKKGEFRWGEYERVIGAAEGKGFEVVGVLGPTALWASGAGTNEAPEVRAAKMPEDWAAWRLSLIHI